MTETLLKWPPIGATDLLILLREYMGGSWQSELTGVRRPDKLYIPLAGPTCRVIVKFKGPKIIAVEKGGEAFDRAQWKQISDEIEYSLSGNRTIGREYSFASRRVMGSWLGERSGVQILPPPNGIPEQVGEYPFILEFPVIASRVESLTNHRRIRTHRDLTLLLNVLLVGGARARQDFFAPLGPCLVDKVSPPAVDRLQEVAPDEYEQIVGDDGSGLRVPSDLDRSICAYEALSGSNREKFDRALFWFRTSSRLWDISMSASYAALVIAIESVSLRDDVQEVNCPVCGKPVGPGPTRLFKNFLGAYAPGESLARDRGDMYDLRSSVVHGGHLVEFDREIPIMGWTPSGHKEREQYYDLWKLTRLALRNWLKNRSHCLQQAHELCAYFHWIDRGQPLWEADVDWAYAEQEHPA